MWNLALQCLFDRLLKFRGPVGVKQIAKLTCVSTERLTTLRQSLKKKNTRGGRAGELVSSTSFAGVSLRVDERLDVLFVFDL